MNWKNDYPFNTYCTEKRFVTYYHQLKKCLEVSPDSVLIIGPGDHIVPVLLKHLLPNAVIETFDLRDGSTYQGDLRRIADIVPRKYDCILCCEVLEHIEFEYFNSIKERLMAMCNKSLIISVPKFTRFMCKYHKWEVDMPVTQNELMRQFANYSTEVFEVNNKIIFICVRK